MKFAGVLIAVSMVLASFTFTPRALASEQETARLSGTEKRIWEVRSGRVEWPRWIGQELKVGKEMVLKTGKTLSVGALSDVTEEELVFRFSLQLKVYEFPEGGRVVIGWEFDERGFLALSWTYKSFEPMLGVSYGKDLWGLCLGISFW